MYLPKNAPATITVDIWTKANRTVPATGGAGSIVWTWWRPGQANTKTAFTPTAVGELGFGRYWLTIPATVPTVDGELFIAGETATAYGDRSLQVGTLDDLAAAIDVLTNQLTADTDAIDLAIENLVTNFSDLQNRIAATLPPSPGTIAKPGYLEIVPGDDYDGNGKPRLRWTFSSTHNYAGGTTTISLKDQAGANVALAHTGYLSTTDALNWTAEVQILAAASATLAPNFAIQPIESYLDDRSVVSNLDLWKFTPTYTYKVVATDAAGKKRTLESGLLVVPKI